MAPSASAAPDARGRARRGRGLSCDSDDATAARAPGTRHQALLFSRSRMAKRYGIREVFATLQGEGAQAGSPAVFLRFAGCNLGYDVCPWCDTDWVKAVYTEDVAGTLELVRRAAEEGFGGEREGRLLGGTGGEPQLA